jgi:hypothetical protein
MRLVLPARFAATAGFDARVIAEATAAALNEVEAPPASMRIELPGAGRTAHALAWDVAKSARNVAGRG